MNMKTCFITLSLFLVFSVNAGAQKEKVSRYETVIYTSDKLEGLIQKEYKKQRDRGSAGSRGYLSDLLNASINAGKGIAGGYVASFVDIGVNAVASLLTANANNKLKWEEVVRSENSYQETLSTLEPINNFYTQPSFDGPMDPLGMTFYGIGCLRTIDKDTAFYISCRINPSKIDRIINHSKFELTLDSLIINPYHCNLPNSTFDTQFSFDRRKNLQITVEMRLISSWINVLTQLQKDQELGCFSISIPVGQSNLDKKGELRYVRKEGVPDRYKIAGESFIIPRSFMGFRDEENNYKDSWGTGDYKIELRIKESCGITDAYRKEWKNDWKQRQSAQEDENIVHKSWKLISSQKWNEITKQWVITTLKAPADMATSDLLEELDLTAPATQAKTSGTTGGSGAGGGKPK
jgi:hypothetical protein